MISGKYSYYQLSKKRFLVINYLTGLVVKVGPNFVRLLEDLKRARSINDDRIVKFLQRNKFIFESQKDEERFFTEQLLELNDEAEQQAPIYSIIITPYCNFNCSYCCEDESFRAETAILSVVEIDRIFALIAKIERKYGKKNFQQVIDTFGGEPLLPKNRNLIERVLKNCCSGKYLTKIFTNGYYLEEYLDLFTAYRKNIHEIQVTLDGTKRVQEARRIPKGVNKSSFDHIIAGLDQAISRGLPVNIRTNVDSGNVKVASFVRFLNKKGWTKLKNVKFSVDAVKDFTLKNMPKLISEKELLKAILPYSRLVDSKKGFFQVSTAIPETKETFKQKSVDMVRCASTPCFPHRIFVFHTDGKIYPCPWVVGKKGFASGQWKKTFKLFPKQSAMIRNNTQFLTREPCRKCKYTFFCSGGCPNAAYEQKGSADNYFCATEKDPFKTFIDLSKKSLLRLPFLSFPD